MECRRLGSLGLSGVQAPPGAMYPCVDALLPVAPHALAVAFLLTAVAAAVQGTIGFGFAILTVPVLSLVDPALAPVPQLLCVWPLVFWMFWRERHAADIRGVGWILVGRLPGAALGLFLLKAADQSTLDLLLGLLVLGAVGILAGGLEVRRTTATKLGAGVASGIFSMVSSIGGPPIALLYRGEKGATIRASLALVFSAGLVITVLTRLGAAEISWRDAHIALFLLPALFGGLWCSRLLVDRVEGRPLRIGILVLASLASLGLLARALWA